jgi:putative transposase
MSDNGCQPTALAFMKACSTLGIQQAFNSYNNPQGNADTERVMRTLKEEFLWLSEWTSPLALMRAREVWIAHSNAHYLHSALGTNPRTSLNAIITSATGLRSWPLDKWGALHQLQVPH